MARLFLPRLVLSVLAVLICLSPSRGDAPESSKISFETADHVIIRGTWYPSSKDGSKSPAVIFVHKLGQDRTNPGWESLAKALQEKGFAVLSFDLRGCGESTVVKEEFWKEPHNNSKNIEKASPKKEEIDFKQFKASYYPVMVNDIMAAKHALELKNNGRECNCGDVVIVAAEDGCGLASLFLSAEWFRTPAVLNAAGMAVPGDPMGKDLAGAVFLSPRPALGSTGKLLQVPIPGWLGRTPNLKTKTGFFLLYGGKDNLGNQYTKHLHDIALNPGKDYKKKAIFRSEVKDTNLAGVDLLKDTLPAKEWIVKYCSEQLFVKRPPAIWVERKNVPGLPGAIPVNQLGCKVPN